MILRFYSLWLATATAVASLEDVCQSFACKQKIILALALLLNTELLCSFLRLLSL